MAIACVCVCVCIFLPDVCHNALQEKKADSLLEVFNMINLHVMCTHIALGLNR